MRNGMRRSAKFFSIITLLLTGSSLLLAFQNCGSGTSGYNPLTDLPVAAPCLGTSCVRDVTTAGFKSNATGILLAQKTALAGTGGCDNSSCFDVGGFCENGGFPGSVFYYQWKLTNGTQAAVATTATCDSNGRFHFLAKVPVDIYNYTYGLENYLYVYMMVIDENGNAQLNPNSTASMNIVVTTMSP
jgi:hypothetical protein